MKDKGLDYHIASNNLLVNKNNNGQHLVHYADSTLKLMSEFSKNRKAANIIPLVNTPLSHISFSDVISLRKSKRNFLNKTLEFSKFSNLLHYTNGMNSYGKKYIPTSGGLNSCEIYPIVFNVENTQSGLYFYNSFLNQVELICDGDFRGWASNLVFFQKEFSQASVALVLTSNYRRLSSKYGLRGYRLCLLDIGHLSNQINLVSHSLDLKVCSTAGFIDDELSSSLNLTSLEEIVFLVTLVGK